MSKPHAPAKGKASKAEGSEGHTEAETDAKAKPAAEAKPSEPAPGVIEKLRQRVAALKARLEARFPLLGKVFSAFALLVTGLRSKDGPTRRMAVLSFLFLFTSLGLSAWGVYRVLFFKRGAVPTVRPHRVDPAEILARQRADLSRLRESILDIDEVQVSLVADGSTQRAVGLEIDLSLEFDSPDTAGWAAGQKTALRSELVTSVATMVGLTRELLLTPEGKARVRDRIERRMDDWLPHGARVKRIYFRQFVVR